MHPQLIGQIPKEMLTVDIGSGHQPWPRADVLVDKFVDRKYDVRERGGTPCVIDKRPMVQGDLCRGLPFRDKAFGFATCTETLNHVEDPEAACAELVRVAHAGYLEIPNLIHELFHAHEEHKWRCWLDKDNVVHFSRRTPGSKLYEAEGIISDVTVGGQLPESAEFLRFLHLDFHQMYIVLRWKDSFSWKIN